MKMIQIGTCEHCKHRADNGYCDNDEKLHEDDYDDHGDTNDHLVYCYYESGGFLVGPDFGCIHWEEKN